MCVSGTDSWNVPPFVTDLYIPHVAVRTALMRYTPLYILRVAVRTVLMRYTPLYIPRVAVRTVLMRYPHLSAGCFLSVVLQMTD